MHTRKYHCHMATRPAVWTQNIHKVQNRLVTHAAPVRPAAWPHNIHQVHNRSVIQSTHVRPAAWPQNIHQVQNRSVTHSAPVRPAAWPQNIPQVQPVTHSAPVRPAAWRTQYLLCSPGMSMHCRTTPGVSSGQFPVPPVTSKHFHAWTTCNARPPSCTEPEFSFKWPTRAGQLMRWAQSNTQG